MKIVTMLLALWLVTNSAISQPKGVSSERTSKMMIDAAQQFVASLNDEQKGKALQKFEDDLRMDWEFYPRPRKGIPLKDMTLEQRILAHALLKTGLSSYGYLKANTIMGIEPVLKALENEDGVRRNVVRDEENYFFAIWGTPTDKGAWGWRVEGHHVSIHFTMTDGKLIANTPLGFGSSPAEIRKGPRAGFRTFAFEEDLGRELITSMTKTQRSVAIIDTAKTPGDLMIMAKAKVDPLSPRGVAYSAMTKPQQALLFTIISEYASRMPLDVAAYRLDKILKGELNQVCFAWYGGLKKGQAHYYRLQGKTFVIEYDNSQTQANHVHSAWRDFEGDFGYDWLAEHLKNVQHSTSGHKH